MSKLLMITGDRALASGKKGAFYNTLEEFHKHWDRIDIICPRIGKFKNGKSMENGNWKMINNIFGNVFIHPSPWPLIFQPFWILRAGLRILKTNHYTLSTKNYLMTVHDFPPFYNGIGAKFIHFFTRVPYVLEIMHIPGLPRAASTKELIYKYLSALFIGIDAHRARAVRVINQNQTKNFLIKAGVPVSKIKYIPAFYIDFDIFKPESVEKKYDLIYAARLEKNKGISSLIKSVSVLRETKPKIKLLVIGQGPELKKLKSEVKNLGLEDNIEFSGWLNGSEDMAQLFNQSRIFVNPSFNEGGPRVVLEAMACGLPVITTKVGLMLDIIKDGENGIFTDWDPKDMAENISKLLQDEGLQNKFKTASLELVKQFEKKEAIKNYADSLNLII